MLNQQTIEKLYTMRMRGMADAFKHGFLGSPLLTKGHGRQEIQVAWAVLTHNLWLTARLPRQEQRALRKAS